MSTDTWNKTQAATCLIVMDLIFFPFHFLFPFSLCHDPNVNCISWPYNQSYSLCSTLVCTKSATTNMEWREYYHNLDYKQCDLRSVPSAWLSGDFFLIWSLFYMYTKVCTWWVVADISFVHLWHSVWQVEIVLSWKSVKYGVFFWKNRVLNSTSES
jgi:hypothetical protein